MSDPTHPLPAGRVVAIYVASAAGAGLTPIQRVELLTDAGLRGDRYAAGTGSFSRWPGSGRAVTLIESEVLDDIRREHGLDLSSGQHRRNIVTAGIRLPELNGRQFVVGGARLRGVRLCEPCRYLQRLVGAGAFAALKHRGGLRADVLEGGWVSVEDPLVAVSAAARLP